MVRRSTSFERRFIRFMAPLEKAVLALAVLLFVLMLLSQALVKSAWLRQHLVEVERMEGIPVETGWTILD